MKMEYNIKGTYEPRSLDEVVGEIGVVTKISKESSLAAYVFGTIWLAATFLGGFAGESFIDQGMARYGASMVPLGVLSATLLPSAYYKNKEYLRVTTLITIMGASMAYYMNRGL